MIKPAPQTTDQETLLSLSGSYSDAGFVAALGFGASVQSLNQARTALATAVEPRVLIWHKFHDAHVGAKDARAMASWLRAIAHENPALRLVFYDEEGEGQ